MIPEVRDLFIRERAPFEMIGRPPALASGSAAASRVAGRQFARVVIVRDGDWYAMTVLPEAARLDLSALRRRTGRCGLIVTEDDEIKGQIPDCLTATMPPFGRVFGLPVYLDRGFAEEAEIVFESGADREAVNMPMGAYVRVERPAIVPLVRAA